MGKSKKYYIEIKIDGKWIRSKSSIKDPEDVWTSIDVDADGNKKIVLDVPVRVIDLNGKVAAKII